MRKCLPLKVTGDPSAHKALQTPSHDPTNCEGPEVSSPTGLEGGENHMGSALEVSGIEEPERQGPVLPTLCLVGG